MGAEYNEPGGPRADDPPVGIAYIYNRDNIEAIKILDVPSNNFEVAVSSDFVVIASMFFYLSHPTKQIVVEFYYIDGAPIDTWNSTGSYQSSEALLDLALSDDFAVV